MRRVTKPRVFLATVGLLAAISGVAATPAFAQGSKSLPALTAVAPDSLTRALARGDLTEAQYALERADSLFRPKRVAARYGVIHRPDPHAATLILRDLAVRVRELSGTDQERALALLARPTDGFDPKNEPDGYTVSEATPECSTHVCIHYVTSTNDAADSAYVDEALDVFENEVWTTEVTAMGYRRPKSDTSSLNNGANVNDPTGAKFDVYLSNLGDDFLYGYCTSDDPNLSNLTVFDMSAYCVVDNDFTEAIFASHTPLENLEVTAAHEFFHAVQFAYDTFEDVWMMEATATWMEDQLYTDINDNLQYLPYGPLGKPLIPLDRSGGAHIYGDWIFFRYLTEKYSPELVRTIWRNADAAPGGRDDFSIQAVARSLSNKGGFRARFAEFGWRNRIARVPGVYDEGRANAYPQSPLTAPPMKLSKSRPKRSKSIMLKHQANAYYEFARGKGVGRRAKLKVVLDLASKSTGAAASALVFKKNGVIVQYTLGISRKGDGTFKLPFGRSVKKVDVVLTNGSKRYIAATCFTGQTPYACGGAKSADDRHTYKLTGKL